MRDFHTHSQPGLELEGDVADPAGTMSGGSQKSGPGVLTRLAELPAARALTCHATGTLTRAVCDDLHRLLNAPGESGTRVTLALTGSSHSIATAAAYTR